MLKSFMSYPKKGDFWDKVRQWKNKGWEISMHGYAHLYAQTTNKKDYFGHGGNSAFSEAGKINTVDGVKIMGAKNILNNLALTASNLYAKNLFNFLENLYDKNKKDIYINKEDEIIKKTLIDKVL